MPRFSLRLAAAASLLMLLTACAGGGSAMISPDHEPASFIPAGPLTPKMLLGVAPAALSARLGAPDFKRKEPIGAEIWQYSGGACNLFVYFYPNKRGALDSTFVDARKTKGGDSSASDCLENVQNRRASVPVS